LSLFKAAKMKRLKPIHTTENTQYSITIHQTHISKKCAMDPVPTPSSLNPNLSESRSSSATTEEVFVQINPEEIGSPDQYGSSALIIDESKKDHNNTLAEDSVATIETPRTAKQQQPFTVNCPKKASAETTNNVCTEPTQKSCFNCMLKAYAAQSACKSQQIEEGMVTITELQNNTVTLRFTLPAALNLTSKSKGSKAH
jgi:hypothetical protein